MMFHVKLERAEDGWFVAEVPALPGCVSRGHDEKEAHETSKKPSRRGSWPKARRPTPALKLKEGEPAIVVAV